MNKTISDAAKNITGSFNGLEKDSAMGFLVHSLVQTAIFTLDKKDPTLGAIANGMAARSDNKAVQQDHSWGLFISRLFR